MKPYLLSDTHYKSLKDEQYDLAILPWGACEAHNYHLPYATDNYETEAFAAEAASRAWEKGLKSIVLPNIPYGVNTGQHDIPGTINLYPSTQAVILNDILESVQEWGIRRFLILNGHGGNDFKQILREAGRDFPQLVLATANWFQAVDKKEFFEYNGDHADEMETSLMLYLRAELVLPLKEAGDGSSKKFRTEALNESWAWSERDWSEVSKDTGIGDPHKAMAEKGKAYFEAVVSKLVLLIEGMIGTDPDDQYQ